MALDSLLKIGKKQKAEETTPSVEDVSAPIVTQDQQPSPKQKNQTPDQILEEMVSNGDLVPDPELINRIKSGRMTVDQGIEATKIIKAKYGDLNKTKGYNLTETAKSSAVDRNVANADAVKNIAIQPEFSLPKYILGSLVEGASIGIYNPYDEMNAPDTSTAVAGFVANMIGGLVTGGTVFKTLGYIPMIAKATAGAEAAGEAYQVAKTAFNVAKASGAAEEVVSGAQTAFKAAKTAKNIANIGRVVKEGAVLGTATGAIKSVVSGQTDPSEILKDSVAEGILFAGTGAVLEPVIGAVGNKIFGGRIARNEAANIAVASDPVAQRLAANPETAKYVEGLKNMTGPLTREQQMAVSAVDKIQKSGVIIDPTIALLSNPAALKGKMREDVATVSREMFLDKQSPFNSLYESNPNLKLLVDSGNHAEALQSVQAFMADELKGNKSLKEHLTAPFLSDVKAINEIVADRVLQKTNLAKYPSLNRSMVIDYLNNPTAENELLLRQASNDTLPKKFGSKKIIDSRLKDSEADKVISSILDNYFSKLTERGLDTSIFKTENKLGSKQSILSRKINENIDQKINGKKLYEMDRFEFEKAIGFGFSENPNISKAKNEVTNRVGKYIINNIGSDDPNKIFDYYKNKYNLKNVSLEIVRDSSSMVAGEFNSKNNSIKIFIDKNDTKEEIAATIRHEIEHVVDHSKGFKATNTVNFENIKKEDFNLGKTPGDFYRSQSRNHHKNYLQFESDYLRRQILKDAIAQGKDVPERILSDYPDLEYKYGKTKSNKNFGNNLKSIQNADLIMSTATTFNKDFQRKLIESYKEGVGTANNNFVYLDEDLRQPMRSQINVGRIMQEKNDLFRQRSMISTALSDLSLQAKRETTQEGKDAAALQIRKLKDDFQVLNKKIAYQNTQLRSEMTAIKSLAPEQQERLAQVYSQIFVPKKQSDQITTNYLKMFGVGDNPLYLKKGSDLADTIASFQANGQDFNEYKTLQGFFIANIENVSRKLNRELGQDNVISRWLPDRYRERAMQLSSKKDEIMQAIREIGIKAGTEESALLQKYGEGRISEIELPLDKKEKIIQANSAARKIYDDLLGGMNAVMSKLNLPQIANRKDYFRHFSEVNEMMPEFLQAIFAGEDPKLLAEKFGEGGSLFRVQRNKSDPNRIFFSAEFKRSGAEFKDDAIGGLIKYVEPALERIYYSDLVREVDTARQFAPRNMGKFLQEFKDAYLLKKPHALDEMTSEGVKSAANTFRRRLAEGSLFWNANTALQQILSMPLNYALGGKEAITSLPLLFSKEGTELAANSKNLALRDVMEHADLEERYIKNKILSKVVPKTAQDGFEYYRKWGRYALETFDKLAAKHAYLTGFKRAMNIPGMTEENAMRFADKYADLIHADMSNVGKPDFYRSVIGKAFGQFQSFVLNFASTAMNDIPNMAVSDGSAAAVSAIMRTMAGISLTNETMRAAGLPAPYDETSFIPFASTYRFGSPGMFQGMRDATMYAFGSAQDKKKASKNLTRFAASIAFPGGLQAVKASQAIKDYSDGKYQDDSVFLKDLLFGQGRMKFEKIDASMAKKSVFNQARKKIKSGIAGE